MTTYKTGNPVGSADPRDLYDNAQVIDDYANSAGDTTSDRLGVSRRTLAGMEGEFDADQAERIQRFNTFIRASGYEFLGDYAAGIEVTEYNQIIRDTAGEFWRASGTTELPYTTDGTGMPEGGAFRPVGDAALRQELDGTLASGQGALNVRGSVIYVDTIADLQALPVGELVDGQSLIMTATGRAGKFAWATGDQSSGINSDPQQGVWVAPSSDTTGVNGAWVRQYGQNAMMAPAVRPEWFGVVGDGLDTTTSAQAAIDYAGDGGVVHWSSPAVSYRVSSLQLHARQMHLGPGRDVKCIVGDGSGPTLITNPYPTDNGVRGITLQNLSVENTDHPALNLHVSPDWSIDRCRFTSTDSPALSAILSVRGNGAGNKVQTSGPTHACEFLDNCNGSTFRSNTITGGQGGSGLVIGRTQVFDAGYNVFEACGGFGIDVAGNFANGGNCTGINLQGSYFEQVATPIRIGLQFTVFGIDLSHIYIGNENTNVVATRNSAFHIGRAVGVTGLGIRAQGTGTEALIEWYDITDGGADGPNPFLNQSQIVFTRVQGYSSDWVYNSGFTVTGRVNRIFGSNILDFAKGERQGVEQDYSTLEIDPAVSKSLGIIPVTPGGGIFISAEIIEKTGDVTCTLRLGYSFNTNEILSLDPQSLTYANGVAPIIVPGDKKRIRPDTQVLLGISPGEGTGSFRVKLRYRVGG